MESSTISDVGLVAMVVAMLVAILVLALFVDIDPATLRPPNPYLDHYMMY